MCGFDGIMEFGVVAPETVILAFRPLRRPFQFVRPVVVSLVPVVVSVISMLGAESTDRYLL